MSPLWGSFWCKADRNRQASVERDEVDGEATLGERPVLYCRKTGYCAKAGHHVRDSCFGFRVRPSLGKRWSGRQPITHDRENNGDGWLLRDGPEKKGECGK